MVRLVFDVYKHAAVDCIFIDDLGENDGDLKGLFVITMKEYNRLLIRSRLFIEKK